MKELTKTTRGNKPYQVREVFYTLQGEGVHAGRPAVFCRFNACNLWNGREVDRLKAICKFCDTDFLSDGPGSERYPTPQSLVSAIEAVWPGHPLESPRPFVVLTGGEPALQVDAAMVASLRSRGFEVAIETNGTIPLPTGIHHVCVSPKAGTTLVVRSGDELKLVWPQTGAEPSVYEGMDFRRFYLQAMDGPDRAFHEQSAARYCMEHPKWRLSVQIHKYLGLR